MGYSEIANGLRFVTENSAKSLRLKDYGIEKGNPANFVVLNAQNGYHAVRNVKVIATMKPRETEIFLTDKTPHF